MFLKIDNRIFVETDNPINEINNYVLTGKASNCFIDLDKFLYNSQTHLLNNILNKTSVSNPKVSKMLGIPFEKKDLTTAKKDVEPIMKKLNKEEFFEQIKIISDIVKEKDLLIGPGRGSSVHCQELFDMGLTKINPKKFGLHDSRFWGYKKNKLDIDIDILPKHKPVLLEEFKKRSNYKLIQKLNSQNKPHNSGYCLCTAEDIRTGKVILKRVKSTVYVSKSSCPTIDLLNSPVLATLNSIDWKTLSLALIDKPLRKEVFQIGDNKLANEIWDAVESSYTIEDVCFILAFIRTKNQADRLEGRFDIKEVDSVLKGTYGVLVYQDQVTEILANVFKTDLYRAEKLRSKLKDIKLPLIKALVDKKYSMKVIKEFLVVLYGQKYLFCKGHALAYSLIAISQIVHGVKN